MIGQRDGQTDRCMNKQMDGGIERLRSGREEGWAGDLEVGGRTDGQRTDRQTAGEIGGQRDRKTGGQRDGSRAGQGDGWVEEKGMEAGTDRDRKRAKVRMGKGQCPAVRTDGRDTDDEAVAPLSAPPRRWYAPVRPCRAGDNGVGAGPLWARGGGGGQEVPRGRAPSCSPTPGPSRLGRC